MLRNLKTVDVNLTEDFCLNVGNVGDDYDDDDDDDDDGDDDDNDDNDDDDDDDDDYDDDNDDNDDKGAMKQSIAGVPFWQTLLSKLPNS